MPTESLFPSSRFSVAERRALLVGRNAEMTELERAYVLARDKKQARTVTIVGASGIGKTRLVRDFLVGVRVREGDRPPRVFRGAARDGGPAYEVFARALRARFGLVEGMDSESAKAQVRAQLSAVLEDRKVGDVGYFLGHLIDLSFQDSPLIRAIEGDPHEVRSMRRAVIKSFLEIDAGKAADPLVLVLDDLQSAHDDSLELLGYLIENLRAPILLVCMARPEMLARHDGWRRHGTYRHVTLELAPLAESDATAVMRDLLSPCGESPDVEELVDVAVTLAGGNPALLDQLVRIYHDTGVLSVTDDFESERWQVHVDQLASVRLPLTVEDAVQARIAALAPEERKLLEEAAAMGGVFWLGGLVAIQRQSEAPPEVWEGGAAEDTAAIRQRLNDLVERDYVLRLPDSTFAGDEEYVFKHNLEREALVRLTPPATARDFHSVLAQWLAFRESSDGREEYLEMLGRQREKAGSVGLAAAAFVKAGEAAQTRYANAKAAELFAKGLALLESDDHPDEDLRLRALHQHGDALRALGRNDEAFRAFLEMLARGWRLDVRAKAGAAHARLGRLYRDTGRLGDGQRHLAAALALFGQIQDEPNVAAALDDLGKLHWLKGDFAAALESMGKSLTIRRQLGDKRTIAAGLNGAGLVQQDSGNFKGALESFEQALKMRRELGDVIGASVTLSALGLLAEEVHEDRKAVAFFQESHDIAKDTGDRNRLALVVAHLGAMVDRLGDKNKAAALVKQAEELTDELGDRHGLAEALRALGLAYLARRDVAKAREHTSRAVDIFTEVESRLQVGVTLRQLGQVAYAGTNGGANGGTSGDAVEEASVHLKRAMAVFDELGNEVELARTCRAYAELLRRMPSHATDPSVAAEEKQLTARAEAVFAKLRVGQSKAAS